ncbi:MAG: efflux RND transporter periplasmic adaptor subunit, partial [Bacteroidota bacterium]
MKNSNIKLIITALVAIGLGLLGGYFLFGNQAAPPPATAEAPADVHQHSEEEIWTCSMHPQIRQNEPGLCPICEMDLIPLEANTSNNPLVLEMTDAAVKLANIQTTTVGGSAAQQGKTLRLSGKVQTDERLASSQVAHVPGRIEKLYVSFTGEQVKSGQQLADIYSPDLIAAQRELLEAKKLSELNPQLLEAARNKLRYWKIEDSIIEAIEQEGRIRETFSLFASASGIVTNRRVAVGDYVQQGQALFDLISLRRVWVLFDAYEEDLAYAKVGDQVNFTTPAVPNKTFTTRITFIDPLINPQTRTASLRAEVSNPRGQLKPEMLVTGTLKK